MEYNKEMKKISGDSVAMRDVPYCHPIICKTIGGATYLARMHFNNVNKNKLEDKLLRLMGEEMKKDI